MFCPPSLEPIPIVIHMDPYRLQHENTATRSLWIWDETNDAESFWWSAGTVVFQNDSEERRRIRYRRRVSVPMPETVEAEGWTDHCWKGGTLALTCTVYLDPGESVEVALSCTSTHSRRVIPQE